MEKNETEQWRDIEGYDDYQVSNEGRVKSLKFGKEKILKGHAKKSGYLQVGLCKDGVVTTKLVHRLVAEAFLPRVAGKDEIDHIIPVSQGGTNEASNLRWCTHDENLNYELTKQKRQEATRKMVEKTSKKVFCYDTNYNFLSGFSSTADASRQMNLSQGNIVNCCNGSIPAYKGYIFSYEENLTKEKYEETLEKGKEKAAKRLKSVNRACRKWQSVPENYEKVKALQRKYYWQKKQMEEWKDIKDYEGLYQVSSEGKVKSLGNDKTRKEKILKGGKNNCGYLLVCLNKDGKPTKKLVHRLVAEAFLENPNNLPEVNHKDETPTNNNVLNLEWCDRKYNMNYSLSKRVDQIDPITGEIVHQWASTREAGRNGFDQSNVAACARGVKKQYKGFIWKYHG